MLKQTNTELAGSGGDTENWLTTVCWEMSAAETAEHDSEDCAAENRKPDEYCLTAANSLTAGRTGTTGYTMMRWIFYS